MRIQTWLRRAVAGALLPAGSVRTPYLRTNIILALLLPLVGLIGTTTLALSAASPGVITVCPAGPPQCDYRAIQPALDVASPADTVLVGPGTYTGQLTLKSKVALDSSDGPEVTIIDAAEGPIVTANGVVSATVRGLSIRGQTGGSHAVGIDLLDSEVRLSDCIISSLQGKDGEAAAPDGEAAIAIRSAGMSNLVIADTTIQDIRGGNGLTGQPGGAQGGSAIAVAVTGSTQITLTTTIIRSLSGGNAGTYAPWPYSCDGKGGSATAIQASGDGRLSVSNSQITDLNGGAPCSAPAAYCEGAAGAAVGIQTTGGTIFVRDSLFSRFFARPAFASETSYAIHTSGTAGTYLERNTITSLSASAGYPAQELQTNKPDSPYCVPPPGTVIAIASEDDSRLVAVDNSLSNVRVTGYRGQAVGILAKSVADAELSRNRLVGISGGYVGLTASGFRLEQLTTAQVNANALSDIHGGDAPPRFYYAYFGSVGGSAAGIELTEGTTATVVNNVIRAVSGGRGTDLDSFYAGQDGGDATALLVTGISAGLRNNTCYQTTGGLGGDGSPKGQTGRAVGLGLAGAGEVIAANNALVRHSTGILSIRPTAPLLDHNDLWANGQDYEGLAPGASDLHVAPGFVDPEAGDLHLSPTSALIDVGTNSGIPPEDIDGEPRPLDGNGDGNAVADISADEYWPGLYGSKAVDKWIATAGDVLTYQLTVANPTIPYMLPGVNVTDTLPSHTTYVPGSLSGTSGTWRYEGGVITWTGALSPGASLTLTFKATVDEVAGPLAIVNWAVLDDHVGVPRTVQAVTLIDPLRSYLPLVAKSH
jgi:uncharacterized repeat protein (TIGR01451 family)